MRCARLLYLKWRLDSSWGSTRVNISMMSCFPFTTPHHSNYHKEQLLSPMSEGKTGRQLSCHESDDEVIMGRRHGFPLTELVASLADTFSFMLNAGWSWIMQGLWGFLIQISKTNLHCFVLSNRSFWNPTCVWCVQQMTMVKIVANTLILETAWTDSTRIVWFAS